MNYFNLAVNQIKNKKALLPECFRIINKLMSEHDTPFTDEGIAKYVENPDVYADNLVTILSKYIPKHHMLLPILDTLGEQDKAVYGCKTVQDITTPRAYDYEHCCFFYGNKLSHPVKTVQQVKVVRYDKYDFIAFYVNGEPFPFFDTFHILKHINQIKEGNSRCDHLLDYCASNEPINIDYTLMYEGCDGYLHNRLLISLRTMTEMLSSADTLITEQITSLREEFEDLFFDKESYEQTLRKIDDIETMERSGDLAMVMRKLTKTPKTLEEGLMACTIYNKIAKHLASKDHHRECQ